MCLVSITDEFKPNVHKKMRYSKETQFSAIELRLPSLYKARYSSVAGYSKLKSKLFDYRNKFGIILTRIIRM